MRLPAVAAFVFVVAAPTMATGQTIAPAQTTALDPNPGKVSLAATYDFTNAYMFRGLRQDDTRVIMFPFAEARIDLHDGADGVNDVALRVGTWNSLNTGAAGTEGPSGKMWYESRFYTTLDVNVGLGITVGGTYTAYPSPNNSFSTVKELGFRVAADERNTTAGLVLRPRALLAFELPTSSSGSLLESASRISPWPSRSRSV
jgi:hypothetical protein